MDRLVEDLFTLTKTELLETEFKENTVDFAMVLQQSIDSVSLLAQQKHILIIMHHLGEESVVLRDSNLLERALNNLLDNVVRYTPCDGKIIVEWE